MPERDHRRGPVVIDRVLDTTLQLLVERGYAFTVDDVACAADVHKTTIYRRWPTKAALVGAAVGRLATLDVPVTRTGDHLADLRRLAVDVARVLRSAAGSSALRAILAAAGNDAELLPEARALLAGRYQLAVEIITDAVAAGLLRDDVVPLLVWEAIVNPLHMRAILGAPATDRVARQLVTLVVDGARRGGPRAPTGFSRPAPASR